MDIKTIGVEEWLNVWEKSATWDIAQSTISSLTMASYARSMNRTAPRSTSAWTARR